MANLTLQLHDIKKGREVREEVWCIQCKAEGHHKDQCPLLHNCLSSGAPSPLNLNVGHCCEIYRMHRQHRPEQCSLLQKYLSTPTSLYCTLFKSVGHDESNCHSYDMMHDRRAYQVQGSEQEG